MHRIPHRHAPQCDRTGKFLMADHRLDNLAESRSRLPREFGGGQRPVVSGLRVLQSLLCQGTALALVLPPPG
jgi:hypothetical protein